jgi:hypothetical protein
MRDAFIVRNRSLREALRRDRQARVRFFDELRRELANTPLDGRCRYGRKNAEGALSLSMDLLERRREGSTKPAASEPIPEFLARIMVGIASALPEYEFSGAELWMGTEAGTRPHNDTYHYLGTGQCVGLQLWVLLEACALGEGGESVVEVSMGKNALECLVPVADGVMSVGMQGVLTPDRFRPFQPTHYGIVGGDDLQNGDILLFKNGVIHRAAGSTSVLRAGLAMRALRREDDPTDLNFLLWFREMVETSPDLKDWKGNPYFERSRATLERLPRVPYDPARLKKVDRNDYARVESMLSRYEFA